MGSLIFGAVFGLRFIIRDMKLAWWYVGILNSVGGLIAFESGEYLPSFVEAIFGFALLTAATFSMVSIIEPTNDYRWLLLSSLFAIEVVVKAFPLLVKPIEEVATVLPIHSVVIVYNTSHSCYVLSAWYVVGLLMPVISMGGYHYQRRKQ